MTVTRKGELITTITLQSASYTATSGRVVFRFAAVRALTVDTALFVLYDSAGENSANDETKLNLASGTHTVTLDFSGTGKPQAVGWVAADGDATWPRNG